MGKNKKCCGECEFSKWSSQDGDYICHNEDGEMYGIDTTYDGNCEDFEEKE